MSRTCFLGEIRKKYFPDTSSDLELCDEDDDDDDDFVFYILVIWR